MAGGHLEDDDWQRYQFGNLEYRYERGVRRVELVVMALAPGRPQDVVKTTVYVATRQRAQLRGRRSPNAGADARDDDGCT